jgi:hypothetical protein
MKPKDMNPAPATLIYYRVEGVFLPKLIFGFPPVTTQVERVQGSGFRKKAVAGA